MLLSISLILILGMFMGWICQKIKLPSLLGMLITGIILGPYGLNLLDGSILGISAELRKIALIIILTRAGLGLDLSGLKKIGRPAVLMCFVPASFELIGMILLAPKLMGLTVLEAAVMGAVLAAVSPAVVVPRMVRLMDEGYGVNEGIPQLILAGASVDDVYVIVLFSTFVGMMQGEGASLLKFVNIPISIFLGIVIGLLLGVLLAYFFEKVHIRDTSKVLIILSISFLLVVIEDKLTTAITFSALIAIMFIGIGLQKKREVVAKRLSVKYGKLWVAAEVFLFVLVGATVNIGYLGKVGAKALIVIIGALVFRMLGVFVCLLGTSLKGKERLFAMIAYTPKATVQAAIGGIPLALGLSCGDLVLSVAVLAIVLTAPLGAFAIDLSYKKWLQRN
ncbi:cation:proton antiporter [Blautia sp. MSJ-19]|uniref:cation:proton antiporter n=1 Tax=Blautia sp. MSJ-19 TaxID=2841517 RepID=UPI001C0F38DE|nr:cation:proton antiporter [Blautia sp. MSJ-19]MBU5480685.1 cation:proton antiporter [Blautia sp. MSJ-19]